MLLGRQPNDVVQFTALTGFVVEGSKADAFQARRWALSPHRPPNVGVQLEIRHYRAAANGL